MCELTVTFDLWLPLWQFERNSLKAFPRFCIHKNRKDNLKHNASGCSCCRSAQIITTFDSTKVICRTISPGWYKIFLLFGVRIKQIRHNMLYINSCGAGWQFFRLSARKHTPSKMSLFRPSHNLSPQFGWLISFKESGLRKQNRTRVFFLNFTLYMTAPPLGPIDHQSWPWLRPTLWESKC